MLSAKIGIDYVHNEAALKESFRGLGTWMVNETGKIMSAMSAEHGKATSAFAQVAATGKEHTKKVVDDTVHLHQTAMEAVGAIEKRTQDLRVQYEHEGSTKVLADAHALEQKKKEIQSAMSQDVSAAAKRDLGAQKSALDQEITLVKRVASEKLQVEKATAAAEKVLLDQEAAQAKRVAAEEIAAVKRTASEKAAAAKAGAGHGAEAAVAQTEARMDEIREQYSAKRKKRDAQLTHELEHDIQHLEQEQKTASMAMAQATEKEVKDELAARKREIDQELVMLKQVEAEKKKASAAKSGSSEHGGGGHGEGGHGGGAANMAGAVNLVEQGIGVVEHFVEKGKEAYEATEKLELGFSRAGLKGEAMEKAMEKQAETAAHLSDKYAISKTQINEMAAAYTAVGGKTENFEQTQEDIIALSKSAGMSYEQAAKALAGATDPEIEKALSRQGIGFDKNATAAERAKIVHEKMLPLEQKLAEQAQGPLGQMQRMQNTMGDLQKTIGVALIAIIGPILPLITSVMNQVSGLVKGLLPPIIKIVESVVTPLIGIFQDLIKPIIDVFQKLLPPIANIIGKIVGIAGKLLSTIVGSLLKAAVPILTMLTGAVERILNALMPLLDVVGQLVEAFLPLLVSGGLLPIFQQILEALLPPVVNIITMVAGLATTLLQALLPVLTPLIGLITSLASMLIGGLGEALAFVIGIVAKLAELLVGGLVVAVQWIVDAVKYGVEWFKALWAALEPVRAMIAEKLKPVFEWFAGAWVTIRNAVSDLVNEFMTNLKRAWDWVSGAFRTMGSWISVAVNWFIKIHMWIANAIGVVVQFGARLFGLGGVFDKVKGWLGGMVQWVMDAINTVKEFLGLVSDAADKSSRLNEGEGKPTEPPPAVEPTEGGGAPVVVPITSSGKDGGRADKAAESAAAKALRLAKEAYDKEIAALQATLDDKNFAIELALQKQEITEQEAEKRKILAQQAFDQESLAAANRHGQNTHKIDQALLKDEVALRINGFNVKKAVRDQAYADDQQALEQRIVDENISDVEAKKLRLGLEQKYYDDLLQITRDAGLSTLKLEAEMAKKSLDVLKDKKKTIDQIEKELAKDAQDRRAAEDAARLAGLDDATEKEVEKENAAYTKQKDDKERQYDQMVTDADGNTDLIAKITTARHDTLEAMERAHQAKIAEIQGKAYDERAKAAVEFGNEVYDAAWGKLQAINDAEKKEKDDAEHKYQARLAVEREREKDPAKRAKAMHQIDLDYNRQKDDIERKSAQQRHENSLQNNMKDLVLQKLHLQGSVRQIIVAKTTEAAVWLASEFQKTAATGQGVIARAGMVATEIWNTLKSAAVSAFSAAASVVKWVAALVPWPFNLGLIPLAVGGVYGAYKGAQALFGFEEGGIASRPIFGGSINGRHTIAAEREPEVIAPLSKLPGLLGLNGSSSGSGGALIAEMRSMRSEMAQNLKAIDQTFQERPPSQIMDQNRNLLSQEQTKAKRSLTRL